MELQKVKNEKQNTLEQLIRLEEKQEKQQQYLKVEANKVAEVRLQSEMWTERKTETICEHCILFVHVHDTHSDGINL